jgi:hypothetical protein
MVVGLTGGTPKGVMMLNYTIPVTCICTAINSSGQEVTFFGSNTGYVYQDNIGTSQDGNTIEAWLQLPFINDKSPRMKKQYRRAIFDVNAINYALLNFSYMLDYGTAAFVGQSNYQNLSLVGNLNNWDLLTWDQFFWDSPFINAQVLQLSGTAKNISFYFYSNRAQDSSHTIDAVTLIYSNRVLER